MKNWPKNPPPDELSDEQLLQQALEGVVPLKIAATVHPQQPQRRLIRVRRDPHTIVKDQESQVLSEQDQRLSIDSDHAHRKNGVQLRTLKKLKRGHYPVEDQLDLHQLNTHTGNTALLEFINYAHEHKLKCIRIIHGKGLHSVGGPKLKLMARETLRSHPQVVAFTSCKSKAGGEGATDVLLKS